MLKRLAWVCTMVLVGAMTTGVCNQTERAFERIYKEGTWGFIYDDQFNTFRGGSGSGSDPRNALSYLEFLRNFMKERGIQSVVDVGCGDWRLARTMDWTGIEYLGVDVVRTLVEDNQRMFGASNIHFLHLDGTHDDLPAADLVICKDVLQHLPIVDIQSFIQQLHKYKYALITNDVDPHTFGADNIEIVAGEHRRLALTEPPFNLKAEKVLCYRCGTGEVKMVLLWTNEFRD